MRLKNPTLSSLRSFQQLRTLGSVRQRSCRCFDQNLQTSRNLSLDLWNWTMKLSVLRKPVLYLRPNKQLWPKRERVGEGLYLMPLIIKKNYNTEHFLSQNPEFKVSPEDKDVVGNIGNLFVISRHTNSKLQNKPPAQKLELLRDRGLQLRYMAKFIQSFGAD